MSPLSTSERNEAIRDLRRRSPRMTQEDIAARLGVSQPLVSRILRLDTIRSRYPAASELPDSTILETLALPAKTQARVLEAAGAHGWTITQTRSAVRLMTDGHTDEATRESVLSGEIDPAEVHVTVTLDGESSRWARTEAARQGASVPQFVAGLLREQMVGRDRHH